MDNLPQKDLEVLEMREYIKFLETENRCLKAERELLINDISEQKFFKLFHYSPFPMSLSYLESEKYIDINQASLNFHWMPKDALIGRTPLELGFWLDVNEHDQFYKELYEKGFAYNHEVKALRNKEIVTSLLSGLVIQETPEKIVLIITVDITELRKYQTEISRLEKLNLVGEMAAGIAHEIRNPLTTVKGFLQLLGSKKDNASENEYFELMISELDRANGILSEFLSLVKNKPVNKAFHDLNAIIENILPLIEADAINTDKYIKAVLDPIKPVFVDEKEMRQLILNLVRNGLEAMPPGKTITIKTSLENDVVVLAIIDQGNGIAPDALNKIGTPFFTTKEKGTGLGLATCYGIASRHDAHIDYVTGLNGTTFYVRF